MMKFYYQYKEDGSIAARVKSDKPPLEVSQIVSDIALPHGYKKFDIVTKEIVFLKRILDKEHNVIEVAEDIAISRIKIDDVNIL